MLQPLKPASDYEYLEGNTFEGDRGWRRANDDVSFVNLFMMRSSSVGTPSPQLMSRTRSGSKDMRDEKEGSDGT